MESIPLADLLLGLRKELRAAQEQAQHESLLFKVEDIEIEVQVGTTKTGGVEGGVKFWVLDAKAEGKIESQKLQTLRLKLTPVDATGGNTLVSDQYSKDGCAEGGEAK
jgi:hypothetical protein